MGTSLLSLVLLSCFVHPIVSTSVIVTLSYPPQNTSIHTASLQQPTIGSAGTATNTTAAAQPKSSETVRLDLCSYAINSREDHSSNNKVTCAVARTAESMKYGEFSLHFQRTKTDKNWNLIGSIIGKVIDLLHVRRLILNAHGISEDELSNVPITVLNCPPYARWTGHEWRVHLRGRAYKILPASNTAVNLFGNKFFFWVLNLKYLSNAELWKVRNFTSGMIAFPHSGWQVAGNFSRNIAPIPANSAGEDIHFEFHAYQITSADGNFDVWVTLSRENQQALQIENGSISNPMSKLQEVQISLAGDDSQATATLVPPEGITIVSDVDDVLRVAEVWNPYKGLWNLLTLEYMPWMNMPDIFIQWSRIGNVHFHYLTDLLDRDARAYIEFLQQWYPPGTFESKPTSLEHFSDMMIDARGKSLRRLLNAFPNRKFILIGDTTSPGLVSMYPQVALEYTKQVSCILIRRVDATDPTASRYFDVKEYEKLDPSKFMFFNIPDDLAGLNLAEGDCVNSTVHQNVDERDSWLQSMRRWVSGLVV